MKRKIFIAIIGLLLILALSSCAIIFNGRISQYEGAHQDCAATAIYSIPGTSSENSDQVLILDTDQYGRTLFAYLQNVSWLTISERGATNVLGLLIMQKSDEHDVYFYGEKNYLFKIIPVDNQTEYQAYQELTVELIQRYFSDDDLSALKQANLWNQPLENDTSALSSSPLQLIKGEELSKDTINKLKATIGSNIRYEFLRKDALGRSMYFILNILPPDENSEIHTHEWYMIMLEPDGSISSNGEAIMQLDRSNDIPSQILDFRNKYNWENK